MFLKLNLPHPSPELIAANLSVAADAPFDYELKRQIENIQGKNFNCMSHTFVVDDKITRPTIEQYQKFFPDEVILPSVGVLRNGTPAGPPACFPPHADRTRIFALNYYIRCGGKNVTTVFYDKYHDFKAGPGTGKMFKYDGLKIDATYHAKPNVWYALNVRQVHSVEDIEDTRVIFTISFHDITMVEFVKKYASYIQVVPATQE